MWQGSSRILPHAASGFWAHQLQNLMHHREGRPQRRACGLSPRALRLFSSIRLPGECKTERQAAKRPGGQRQPKSKPDGPRPSRLRHETALYLAHRPNGRQAAVSLLLSTTRLLTRLQGEVWFSCPPLPRFLASLFASLFAGEREAASAVGGGGTPRHTATGEMEETPTSQARWKGEAPRPQEGGEGG